MTLARPTTASTEATADELARLTLELCRIPSETLHEDAIARRVHERCAAAAGAEAVRRVGNSVICEPFGRDVRPGEPTIALVGHLDTVKCADRQEYAVRDGRVYGCGASDMKGGLAVMLALLERWRELEHARPLWIFYDGEEGPAEGNAIGPLLTSGTLPAIDFAFILEPTDRGVQPGCMGVLHATVTVRGTRGHSARPWLGDNAVYRAIPLLERFRDLPRREVRFGDLSFYEVMVVTRAETSNSRNVIPDAVEFNVNVRFAPGRTMAEAEAELRAFVGDAGDVAVTDAAPAGDVHADHPLIVDWCRAEGLTVAPKQAWTDVARFTENGIPAVNFGPGETSQAHQADEWCSVDSLAHCYGALRRWFAR